MAQQGVSADVHLERAQRHRKVGDALHDAPDEWAAVCYFYAGYHLVQHALLTDPVFDDATALSAIHMDLTPDHRFTQRHKGRRRKDEPREWGVNDIVLWLYRPIAGTYDRLHQASIHVRYESGLALPLERIRCDVDALFAAHDAGTIRAGGQP